MPVMNSTEMVNIEGLRLEDEKGSNFTDDTKLSALNNAQTNLAHKLKKPYLTELQEVEDSLTATSGEYALSSLNFDVLGGGQGILRVKINGGKYCTEIDRKDLKAMENFYTAGSINNPMYYVFENKIHISNGQTNPTIDVYYYKVPTDMIYVADISALGAPADTGFIGDDSQGLSAVDDTYNGIVVYSVNQESYHVVTDYVGETRTFTVSPAADANFGDDEITFIANEFDNLSIKPSSTDASLKVVTCDLNPSLHSLVIDIAEAECWAMDAEIDRKNAATQMADLVVTTLNDQYVEAEGIGTDGVYRRMG